MFGEVIATIPLDDQDHSAPSNKTKLRQANAEFRKGKMGGEWGNGVTLIKSRGRSSGATWAAWHLTQHPAPLVSSTTIVHTVCNYSVEVFSLYKFGHKTIILYLY